MKEVVFESRSLTICHQATRGQRAIAVVWNQENPQQASLVYEKKKHQAKVSLQK